MENETRQNNFDFLRFLAASLVIISHSFSLLKNDQFDFLGSLGVTIFFIISGYLITQSWVYSPKPAKFLTKRLLRILPALIFCTLVTMFLIGPLNTSLSFVAYMSSIHTWTYVRNIFLYPLQFTLPGVFENNPSLFIVNHSLWTLPLEFSAYVFVLLFGVGRVLKKQYILGLVILLIVTDIFLQRFSFYSTTSFYDFGINGMVPYIIYFFIGSFVYLAKIKIRFNLFFFLCALTFLVAALLYPILLYTYYLVVPYLVFSLVFFHKKVSLFGKTDPSYGMYLFSMPIQQSLIHFFPTIPSLLLLLISYPMILGVAFISWNFIEVKSLSLKKHL